MVQLSGQILCGQAPSQLCIMEFQQLVAWTPDPEPGVVLVVMALFEDRSVYSCHVCSLLDQGQLFLRVLPYSHFHFICEL
uniref:Uncharacterized protein n=1 Tax=Kalanchoe fedtschenkoi TaxID=63787 RepID=A0A7N0T9C2_KALFE